MKPVRPRSTTVLLFLLSISFITAGVENLSWAAASSPLAADRVDKIASWLTDLPNPPAKPISDRSSWEALAQKPEWAKLIREAEDLASQIIPELTDELYLDYSRTGNRNRCQSVMGKRDQRLTVFALAEALENKGRFIKPLAQSIEAVCAEKTWVLPAHDRNLDNFNAKDIDIDLRSSLIAWELATIHAVMGSKLPDEVRSILQTEVHRRVLRPFRDAVEGRKPGSNWRNSTHNWNSVCLAGVVGAAVALEPDKNDRAWYIAAAEHFINNFLAGFTPDGYCSEGLAYWNYGFGRFLLLSETVRQTTGGHIEMISQPTTHQPAMYAIASEVLPDIYPAIADCRIGTTPEPVYVAYVAERLQGRAGAFDDVRQRIANYSIGPALTLAFLPERLDRVKTGLILGFSPLRTWFSNAGVLICRPGPTNKLSADTTPFAAVLKGGHNAEHHNHNDVGSFTVIAGRSMVLCDPGSEVYTARTFGPNRYDSRLLSSYGHMVPVLGGKLQRTGAQARAEVLSTRFTDEEDTLVLDYRSAYDLPSLEKLERTFVFNRGEKPSLSVSDEIRFGTPQTVESALVTFGAWRQIAPRTLEITESNDAVLVQIDTNGQEFTLNGETLDEDTGMTRKPTRIAIKFNAPVATGTIRLLITPK